MKKEGPLKDVVKKIIGDLEKKEKEELDVLKIWKKTVGTKAAKHTSPAFLKGKRLVVCVSDSAWLYKLTLEKSKLIQKFNNNIKSKKKIRELQFRIGNVRKNDKGKI